MPYSVKIKKSAQKEIRNIPKSDYKKIISKIFSLEDNPRPYGYKKLKGNYTDYYRVRVGIYRIIYTIEDDILTIEVIKIGHRKDIYNI